MALDLPGLTTDLGDLFANPPQHASDVYAAWASAIRSYTTAVVPAVPAPTQDAAKAALQAALAGMEAPGAAVGVIVSAVAVYSAALAAGMVPPGVPPPSSAALLAALYAAVATPTSSTTTPAAAIANALHTYFLTGTSAPPTSLPWS